MSYGVMYAVSGRVIDVVGTRKGFVIFVAGWSVANMLHVFAASVGQFSFFRFLLGAFEPGSFTGGLRAVSEWFPMKDRALAIGIFNAGTAVGSMMAAPVVSFIAVQWGWRSAFVATGLLGFLWLVGWWWFYQLPKDHPRLSEAERALITQDSCADAAHERAVPFRALFKMRETWGCILIRALTDPISYFLLFWVPLYFQKRHGFDLKQLGMFVWIPFAAAALGSVASGAVPRFLISRGWELDRARKATMTFMTIAMFGCAVSATQVAHAGIALALVASMTFCHAGWGNITLPAEIFPKNAVGTVTGLGGDAGLMDGGIVAAVHRAGGGCLWLRAHLRCLRGAVPARLAFGVSFGRKTGGSPENLIMPMNQFIPRRNFLKQAAVLTAGATLLPRSLRAANPSETVGIAVIGCNGRGLQHITALLAAR